MTRPIYGAARADWPLEVMYQKRAGTARMQRRARVGVKSEARRRKEGRGGCNAESDATAFPHSSYLGIENQYTSRPSRT